MRELTAFSFKTNILLSLVLQKLQEIKKLLICRLHQRKPNRVVTSAKVQPDVFLVSIRALWLKVNFLIYFVLRIYQRCYHIYFEKICTFSTHCKYSFWIFIWYKSVFQRSSNKFYPIHCGWQLIIFPDMLTFGTLRTVH